MAFKSPYLIANQAVSIPQQNKAFEIALDQANVVEQVMCLSAREKLNSDFGFSLVEKMPRALPVSSLNEVLQNYQQKTAVEVSQQVLSIKVQ